MANTPEPTLFIQTPSPPAHPPNPTSPGEIERAEKRFATLFNEVSELKEVYLGLRQKDQAAAAKYFNTVYQPKKTARDTAANEAEQLRTLFKAEQAKRKEEERQQEENRRKEEAERVVSRRSSAKNMGSTVSFFFD